MFDPFFGKYLLERKYVSLPRLRSLLERLDEAHVRIGVSAIHEGLMNAAQVERILQIQQKEDLRFGELAVREGFLRESDLQRLLKGQRHARLSLGQLLMDDGIFTFDQLEKLFHEYRRDSGLTKNEIEALNRNDINGVLGSFFQTAGDSIDIYREYVRLFLKNVVRFVSPNIHFVRMEILSALPYRNVVYQNVQAAAGSIAFGISGEADDLVEFARMFMPIDSLQLDEMARDALGEFLNIQNGLYLSQLSERGLEQRVSPPEYRQAGILKGDPVIRIPFSLPFGRYDVAIAASPRFEESEARAGRGRSLRIVIADDSAVSRCLLRNILTDAGYEVTGEAADGEAAIAKYLELRPDLITMDVTMPRMDGIDALKAILKADPDARVVMITALSQSSVMLKALKNGVKDYIVKPIDARNVLNVVSDVLKNVH